MIFLIRVPLKAGLFYYLHCMQLQITSIELYKLRIPLKQPFVISLGAQYDADNVLVIIRTNKGISGYGECSAGATPHTTWYPARPASANVARRGTPPSPESLAYPKARRAHAATLATAAFFTKAARCFSFASTLISLSVSMTDTTASFGNVFGSRGLKGVIMSGYLRTPSYVTSMFWTALSSRSI